MAANSEKTPKYEYTKGDFDLILVFADKSELPAFDRWEEATLTPNGEAATLPGSGQFERAHGKIYYKPDFAVTFDADFAAYVVKRANGLPLRQVKMIRQRPGASPIIDLVNDWQPPMGEIKASGDVSTCELKGRALSFKLDSTNKLATPGT